MTAQLSRHRQRLLAPRGRPPGPPDRRGGPRDPRGGARRPPQRGGLHLRRHRGRQPRRQGPVLGPPRRRPGPHPGPRQPRRAPRRPRRGPLARRTRGRHGRVPPRRRATAASTPTRCARPSRATPTTSPWPPSCGPTTRSARSCRSANWPTSPREFDVPLHADAVQAFGQVAVDFAASGLAAMTVSRPQDRRPVRHRRAAARPRAQPRPRPARRRPGAPRPLRHPRRPRDRRLRGGRPCSPPSGASGSRARSARCATSLVAAVRAAVPDAILGGDPAPDGRLPANAHFTFPGCEGDSLLLLLDAQGIECSTGSACTAGVAQPSHVLLATGTDPRPGPRHPALLPRPHLHARPTSTAVAEAIGPAVERARTAGLS